MIMDMRLLPVGISDFKKLITGNYCYVDKTLFIKDILDKGDSIILIPRPRRFGKTLNLSMLKYFYDCSPPTGFPGSESPTAGGTQKEQPGYVIEFKAVDTDENETVPAAVETALKQIEEKKYETELIGRSISNRKKLAVVFSGKDVYVKEANK